MKRFMFGFCLSAFALSCFPYSFYGVLLLAAAVSAWSYFEAEVFNPWGNEHIIYTAVYKYGMVMIAAGLAAKICMQYSQREKRTRAEKARKILLHTEIISRYAIAECSYADRVCSVLVFAKKHKNYTMLLPKHFF